MNHIMNLQVHITHSQQDTVEEFSQHICIKAQLTTAADGHAGQMADLVHILLSCI